MGEPVELTISVTNKSKIDGSETVQLYVKKSDDNSGPNRELRAVKKVFIKAGKTEKVSFILGEKELKWWSEKLNEMTGQPGEFTVEIGSSSDSNDLEAIQVNIR